jgi:hypothetical protein
VIVSKMLRWVSTAAVNVNANRSLDTDVVRNPWLWTAFA